RSGDHGSLRLPASLSRPYSQTQVLLVIRKCRTGSGPREPSDAAGLEDWLLELVPFRLPLIDGPLGNGITDTIGPDSVISRWRAVFKDAFIKESWPARLILSRPEALPQRGLQRVFTGIVQGLAQIESIHSRPG